MTARTGGGPARITVAGLRAHAHHGVYDVERADGQEFRADITFEIASSRAAASDDVADTISYGEVARTAQAILAGEPVDLLETLAERMATAVLGLGADAVEVTIHKPQAPVGVRVDDITLTIRRTRTVVDGAADLDAGATDGGAGPGVDAGAGAIETADSADAADAAAVDITDIADPRLHESPDGPVPVVLALGANLATAAGGPTDHLRIAVGSIAHADGVHVTAVSPLVTTAAFLAPGQAPQDDYVNAVVLATTTRAPAEVLALARGLEDAAGRVRTERWGPRTLDVDVISYGDVVSADPALVLPHPRAAGRAFVLLPWSLVDPPAELPGPDGGRVAKLAETAADRGGVRSVEDWDPLGEARTDPGGARSSGARPADTEPGGTRSAGTRVVDTGPAGTGALAPRPAETPGDL